MWLKVVDLQRDKELECKYTNVKACGVRRSYKTFSGCVVGVCPTGAKSGRFEAFIACALGQVGPDSYRDDLHGCSLLDLGNSRMRQGQPCSVKSHAGAEALA